MPPIMVAPERDVPGMSASACANPSFNASFQMSSSTELMVGWRKGPPLVPTLGKQNNDTANDECQCDRNRFEQGRLYGFAKRQAKDGQRHECNRKV